MTDKWIEDIKKETNWYNRARMILIYHTFQQVQHGTRRTKGWTITKTAEVTGLSIGYISEALSLAKTYIEDPGNISREAALKYISEKNGK